MKFVYSPENDETIIYHEEKMLKIYSDIIDGYRTKFEQYNCTLKVYCEWTNSLKDEYSIFRLPFKNGYMCYVHCDVEWNGKLVHYEDEDGELEYRVLLTDWNISSVSRLFFHLNAYLSDDISDIAEEMEELLDIAEDLYKNGGFLEY